MIDVGRSTDPALDSRAQARRRHPCMRPPVSAHAMRGRAEFVLEVEGFEHPEVAAAVLQARGRSGLDVVTFAVSACVGPETVRRAEAGQLARHQLPDPLRRLVPMPASAEDRPMGS